tara:strand:+ start:1053 stop:2072 length:1020 start_codon:yes stop_codon:yes gene_type:complete
MLALLMVALHISIITLKKIKKENLYYVLLNQYQKNNYKHLKKSEVSDLLKGTWYRNWIYAETVGFIEGPLNSKFVNVNDFGVRSNNGKQVNFNDLNEAIWFFGGSSTFGYGIEDENTIPAQLEKLSNEKVINFGMGFYYSFQENHLLKSYLKTHRPKSVIFLDGHNEACKIYAYQEEMKQLFAKTQTTYDWELSEIFEPLLFYVKKINKINRVDNNPWEKHTKKCKKNNEIFLLSSIVDDNLKERDLICKNYKIKCITFLQPFPRMHAPHQDKSRLSDAAAESMKKLYEEISPIFIKYNANTLENIFKNKNKHYYVDASHYSKEANEIIAKNIFKIIDN